MLLNSLFILSFAGVLTFGLTARSQTSVESNVPGAGFDQQPSGTQHSTAPTLKVYSRETIVDVLVDDGKGNPVRGLTRADFTIFEDGKPEPIRSFGEFSNGMPAPPAAILPPNTYSNALSIPANGPVQIFYFDLPYESSYPGGTDYALDTAKGQIWVRAKNYIAEYLRKMPAGTEVAVFAYRPDYGLHLLQSFTTDGQQAAAAVDNLVVLSVGKPPSFDPVTAADEIAAYVAGIHGRKNLIWVAIAPPMITRDGGLAWSKSPDMALVHRLMDTYDVFTREQIAIYPFNPCGVPVPPEPCPAPIGLNTLKVEDIATGTGGAAIYNTNDFTSAAAKIVDDTSDFYTLSYIPPRPFDDGRYHSISIKVNRPGLHLIYRGGYNDEHPAATDDVLRVHMSQASMGPGSLPSTQLTFNVQVQPAPSAVTKRSDSPLKPLNVANKEPITYNALFTLQPSQITFAKGERDSRTTSLEFDLAAYNPYGKLLNVRSQTLKLTFTPEEYRDFLETRFQFFLPIDLPPGQVTLRVGVFEGRTNQAGTIEIPLTVSRK